jgi:amino-acid N-acetyltransferase
MAKLIRTLQTPAGNVAVASRAVAGRRGRAGEGRTRGEPRIADAATGALRKARMSDAPAIQALVTVFADRDEMLHRSIPEIHEHIRDYFVIEEEGEIVGCVALHVDTEQLAEIKALAVNEVCQGRGYGRDLVTACVGEGRDLGLATVFALTYVPVFFEKLGFRVVDKATLPHKVWTECIRCPKFPDCGEIAVVMDLA